LPQTSDALVGSGTPPRNPAPAGEPPPAAPPPSPTTH
jgi:hypothetical protein